MKKISLLACFLLFVTFFSSLNAQITIGTGTAFSEKYPFNGFYKYSWSNVIYLSSEINTSGSLTSVAFYVDNSPVNFVMDNQKIYARHTSASNITGTNYPTTDGFTLVYDGSVTYNGTGWKTINFTTPFQYNGTSNIEFLFENKAGTYSTGFPYFRYTSTPAGTVNYRLKRDYYDTYFPTDCPAYCSSINNIPNIKLTIQPCTFNIGTVVSSPSLVVPGNQTTVSISGQDPSATIQWQSSTDNINFRSITGATSTTLIDNINVTTYYRALLNTSSCTKISSTTAVTADLSSMVVKSIGTGTSTTQNYPFNHLYNYNWSNMIYKASEINSSGKLSRIAVNVANNPVNVTMPNQKIWVRHTTATSYPNATYPTSTGYTLVYDGSISYNGSGWKEIVLNGNFTYNGTDNLEFLFENRSGLYAPYYPTFYYESGTQTEYRVRKDNQDASFPVAGSTTAINSKNLMNIQLKFIPCSLNAGTISSSASTFCSGTTTTLTLANQTASASIQWQSSSDNVNWVNTGNTASITNTSLAITSQTGTKYYKAIITLNGCTTTTSVQTLTSTPASVAGTITGGSTAVCAGTNSTTLTLSGNTGTIQWQSSSSLTGTYTNISGATSASYVATNLSATTYYKAVVTSGTCSSATTSAQTITVNPISVAGTITGATTVCSGTNSTTLTLSGNTGTIQWQSSPTLTGTYTAISGATSSTLNVTNLSSATYYQAVVTSATCVSATTPAVAMIITPVSEAGTITGGTTAVCAGTNSTTLTLTGYTGNIQWQSSSSLTGSYSNIVGATSATYVATNLLATTYYKAVVTSGACASATTSAQTITVNPISVAGTITDATTVCSGTNSTTLTLSGNTGTIQWQSSPTLTGPYTTISGATYSTLNVTNLSATTYYQAFVTSANCASATSPSVTMTVTPLSIAGTIGVTGSTSYCSTTNSTTLTLSGNVGTIQWQSSTSANPTNFTDISGETSSSLVLTNLSTTNNYRAVVTNGICSSATTLVQTISINPIIAGTISATPSTIIEGQSSSIILTGQTLGATIQWQQINSTNSNYTTISGQTSSTLLATNIQETTTYKAIVSNNGCVATSNEVTVSVDASNLITASIGNGTSVTEKYPFNGNYDYSWTSMIYKASEINTSGSLSRLSFYVNNNPVNETMNNQKIYVRHTKAVEQTDLNYPTTQGFTLVYDGSISYNGTGWKEIVLQTPFVYNGLDNLEFLFENRDGSYSTNFPTFYFESGQAEYRTKRDYKLGSFPTANSGSAAKFANILNIKMKFVPCTTNAGTISATSTTVAIGSPISLNITGQDQTATIQWQKSWDNVNFDVISGQTASTCSLPMIATNLYLRAVVTNGCSQITNVVFITPNTCFTSTASIGTNATLSTEKYPFNGFYNNSWVSVIYKSTELGQAGKLASASFNVVNSPVNFVMNKQRIYARHTTKTEYLDSIYPDTIGFKLIFDGSITYNGSGWKEIPFSFPFDFNGTNNVEFLFENRDGSWGTGYPMFGYSDNQDGYRVKRDYRDTDFPVLCENCRRFRNVPNIKIKFLPSNNVAGTISQSETEICSGKTSVLSIEGQVIGSTIQWQKSTNNVFTDIDNQNEINFIVEGISELTNYRAKVTKLGCVVYTNVVSVSQVCVASAIFPPNSNVGSITVDIASVVDKVGPYNYYISQSKTPAGEVIDAIKTSENQTLINHTFGDLKPGNYFVSVYDSRNIKLIEKEVYLSPVLNTSTNTGFTVSNSSLISSTNNSKIVFDEFMTEQTNVSLQFKINNAQKSKTMGLIPVSNTLTGESSFEYGFKVTNGVLSTIEHGVLHPNTFPVNNNSTLELKQSKGQINYLINGETVKTVYCGGWGSEPTGGPVVDRWPWPTRTGVYTEFDGDVIDIRHTGFEDDYFEFRHTETNYNCDGVNASLTFNLFPLTSVTNISYTINNVTKNGISVNSLKGTYISGQPNVVNNIEPGVYHLVGTYTYLGSVHEIVADFIIGYQTVWEQVENYVLVPNTYSLTANIDPKVNIDIVPYAISKNVLNPSENGEITFDITTTKEVNFLKFISVNHQNNPYTSVDKNYIVFIPNSTKKSNKNVLVEVNYQGITNQDQVTLADEDAYIFAKSKIKAIFNSNEIEIYADGVFLYRFPRPSGKIYLKMTSSTASKGSSFENVLTSFPCEDKLCNNSILTSKNKLCFPEGIQLSVVNNSGLSLTGAQYTWSGFTNSALIHVSNPTVFIKNSENIFSLVMNVPDVNGIMHSCPPIFSEKITLNDCLPEKCNNSIIASNYNVCVDDFVQLSVVNNVGESLDGVTYNWTPSQGLSCTNCPNPLAEISGETTYSLTISYPYYWGGGGDAPTPKHVCPVISARKISIKTTDCGKDPLVSFDLVGCSFGNYGAGVYVSEGTKLNVYCNVINELALSNSTNLQKGEFYSKGDINTTKAWTNNAQNDLYISPLGKTELFGDYQKIGGTSSIHFNDMKISGSGKKEIFTDEYIETKLNLTNNEFSAKNNTLTLNNPLQSSLSRENGFISTDEANGYFERKMTSSTIPYLFPMGSTGSIVGGNQNPARYRPIEVTKANNGDLFKAHFENTIIPTSAVINTNIKAPNVLSLNDKYYYKFASTSVSSDLGITAYYNQADGSFQAISHWVPNVTTAITNDNWWMNTPGSTASLLPSTDPNTYGLLSAGTVGLQTFQGIENNYAENFTLAQAGFYINTNGFPPPFVPVNTGASSTCDIDTDGDHIPDYADVTQTGGIDSDNDQIDDVADISNNLGSSDQDNDGIIDSKDLDQDGDGICNDLDVDNSGGTDIDGNGIDDGLDPNNHGGTTIVVNGNPSHGGGLGGSTTTGSSNPYAPTPLAGTYTILVTPGNCGITGTVEFKVLTSGQIDETSIKYYPDGSLIGYKLSPDLYSIDHIVSGLNLKSTPTDILEKCVSALQINMGSDNNKFVLEHNSATNALETITISKPLTSGFSYSSTNPTFRIYKTIGGTPISSTILLPQEINTINLNVGPSPWVVPGNGTYHFEFDVQYAGTSGNITKTIKGQFLIK